MRRERKTCRMYHVGRGLKDFVHLVYGRLPSVYHLGINCNAGYFVLSE